MIDDLLRGSLWLLKALLLAGLMMMPYILDAVAQIYFDLPPDRDLKL